MTKQLIILIFCVLGMACSSTELGTLPENDYYNIENNSNTRYADRVLACCLTELNIENTQFVINDLNNVSNRVSGILINTDEGYQIYLRSGLEDHEIIRVLCHESFHIYQFENGSLRILTEKMFEFNQVTYDISEVTYLQRPWELQALINAPNLNRFGIVRKI